MKKPFDAVRIASEIHSFVETAVGEMASDMLSPSSGFLDEAWSKRIKNAKRAGVRDLTGWLADELYNDVDTLTDLIGDRICDAVSAYHQWHKDQPIYDDAYRQVCEALAKRAHPALQKACEKLQEDQTATYTTNPEAPNGAGTGD